jgi:hypothetical protein
MHKTITPAPNSSLDWPTAPVCDGEGFRGGCVAGQERLA